MRFLIDGILESRHASLEEKETIINKLQDLAGINFISHLEDVKNMNLETPGDIFQPGSGYLKKLNFYNIALTMAGD